MCQSPCRIRGMVGRFGSFTSLNEITWAKPILITYDYIHLFTSWDVFFYRWTVFLRFWSKSKGENSSSKGAARLFFWAILGATERLANSLTNHFLEIESTPRKSNIDTKNGHTKNAGSSFSKAHHFGYPAVSFFLGGVTTPSIELNLQSKQSWKILTHFNSVTLIDWVFDLWIDWVFDLWIDRLIDWLIDWLIVWLTDCLASLIDWLFG